MIPSYEKFNGMSFSSKEPKRLGEILAVIERLIETQRVKKELDKLVYYVEHKSVVEYYFNKNYIYGKNKISHTY